MYTIAKKKKLDIDKAVKKPGALRKELGATEGKPIPAGKIDSKLSLLRKKKPEDKTEKEKKLQKRLNFAKTLKGLKKKKSETIDLIIKTANTLDELGMVKEADTLDTILKYVSADMADSEESIGDDPGKTNYSEGSGDTQESATANPTPWAQDDEKTKVMKATDLPAAQQGNAQQAAMVGNEGESSAPDSSALGNVVKNVAVKAVEKATDQQKCQCGQPVDQSNPGSGKCSNCNRQNQSQQPNGSQPAAPGAQPMQAPGARTQ